MNNDDLERLFGKDSIFGGDVEGVSWGTSRLDGGLTRMLDDGTWEQVTVWRDGDGPLESVTTNLGPGITCACRTYWGSHGCDKERGHRGSHVCLSCCQHRLHWPWGRCETWWDVYWKIEARLRRMVGKEPRSSWLTCAGRWPYYGAARTHFFGEDVEGG